MRYGFLLFCIYGLSTAPAQASNFIDLGSSICSGEQSVDSSAGLVFEGTGDFSLEQGSLISDTSISLDSKGKLILKDFKLEAPRILLTADESLELGTNVSITGNGNQPTIIVSAGELTLIGSTLNPQNRSPLAGGAINVSAGGNLSLGTDIAQPVVILVPPGGNSLHGSDGEIRLMPPGPTTSVPVPASISMLISGLLFLVSASKRLI